MRREEASRPGPDASAVAVGTWGLGGAWGEVSASASDAVRAAWDAGITFFDTARAYGWGAAERTFGQLLRTELATERERIVIATKGGVQQTGSGRFVNAEPEYVESCLVDSLEALGTDYVDIYLVHWPDGAVPIERTAERMYELLGRGLTRYIGVSNFSVSQMRRFLDVAPIHVAQLPYNLFRRDIEPSELPFCVDRGISVMGYQPYAGGVLAGSIRPDTVFAEGDWRRDAVNYRGERFERMMAAVDRLEQVAAQWSLTMAQLALAWVVSKGGGQVVPVVGAEHPAHIDEVVAGMSIRLDRAQLQQVEDAVGGVEWSTTNSVYQRRR